MVFETGMFEQLKFDCLPHPRKRINSGLYKINMDDDEDDDNDELFVIKMSESITK